MRFAKWLWRALTRVSIEVDAEGNCRVYPCLIGYFKNKEWKLRQLRVRYCR